MIGTVVRSIASRLGWTEGQVDTAAIGLALAVILLIAGIPPALREIDSGLVAATPPSLPAPAAGSNPLPPVSAGPALPPGARPAIPLASPAPTSTPSPTTTGLPPTGAAPPPTDPPPSPCDAQPVVEATDDLLRMLNATVEAVPSESMRSLLATLAGCSDGEPAIAVLALLAETGAGLPDPGIETPLPGLPFVEIPAAVAEALQPLRPALDPVCAQIGTSVSLIVLAFGPWPLGVDNAYLTAAGQALSACGQLQAPR